MEWRCAGSLSLREFPRLGEHEPVPDHSRLSRTRGRPPLEAHDAVFAWVPQRLAERGLVGGARIGIDAWTLEAGAALRAIVRRETGEGYRGGPTRMAKAGGIETPKAEDPVWLDRRREAKRLSNTEWKGLADPDARLAELRDGRTHLAHKPGTRPIPIPARRSRRTIRPPPLPPASSQTTSAGRRFPQRAAKVKGQADARNGKRWVPSSRNSRGKPNASHDRRGHPAGETGPE